MPDLTFINPARQLSLKEYPDFLKVGQITFVSEKMLLTLSARQDSRSNIKLQKELAIGLSPRWKLSHWVGRIHKN
jgi:hypothetical protein